MTWTDDWCKFASFLEALGWGGGEMCWEYLQFKMESEEDEKKQEWLQSGHEGDEVWIGILTSSFVMGLICEVKSVLIKRC